MNDRQTLGVLHSLLYKSVYIMECELRRGVREAHVVLRRDGARPSDISAQDIALGALAIHHVGARDAFTRCCAIRDVALALGYDSYSVETGELDEDDPSELSP